MRTRRYGFPWLQATYWATVASLRISKVWRVCSLDAFIGLRLRWRWGKLTNGTLQSKITGVMSIETPAPMGERTSWHFFRRYPLDVLWRFFASPGVARIWLACLLVATIVGAFLPQAPPDADRDPMAYHRWLATIAPQYGSWGDWVSRVGLLNLRSALWYRGLWALAVLNLLVVGTEQIGLRWRAWRGSPSKDTWRTFLHGVSDAELRSAKSPSEAAEAARTYLRGIGYRVTDDLSSEGTGRLGARKHGLAWLAPVVLHAGLLLLLLGTVVNQRWSWREGPFSLAAGETHRLAHIAGQELRLDETWLGGGLEDPSEGFLSTLTLKHRSGEDHTLALRRNTPALHDGMLIYQVASGPALRVSLDDAAGESVLLESLDGSGGAQREILALLRQGKSEIWLGAPSRGIALHVSHLDSPQDSAQGESILRFRAYRGDEPEPIVDQSVAASTSLGVDGGTCHLVVESYASILVVWSPGLVLVATGALLALVGFCLVMALSPRGIWLDVTEGRRKGSRVFVTIGGKNANLWARSLLDDVGRVLGDSEDQP